MQKELPSFEKDLWGQYNILHDRLLKQIEYYKNLKKVFTPIHTSFIDLNKKMKALKFSMDPTILFELSIDSKSPPSEQKEDDNNWYGIPLTMKIIKDIITNDAENYTLVLFHAIQNIESLINKMKQEKSEYDEFLKCLSSLLDSKKIMDKNMKVYHQKMCAAEQAVIDLKKVEVQNMRINDCTMIQEKRRYK